MPRRPSLISFCLLILLLAISVLLRNSFFEEQPTEVSRVKASEKTGIRKPYSGNMYRPAGFDYYILALSWSPGFCMEADNVKREQCRTNRKFVLHGLWPQNIKGYPSNCPHPVLKPSGRDLAPVAALFPDTGLAYYQWRKHGTCSNLAPKEYFAQTDQAYQKVKIPSLFMEKTRSLSLSRQQIKQAFSDSNPGLRPFMLALKCSRGILQEIRFCMDRNLKTSRRCEQDVRDQCGTGPVIIYPG